MKLILTQPIKEHLIKLCAAYYPREMCGVLTGRINDEEIIVRNFHWMPNISTEPGQWDYVMDPVSYFDIVVPTRNNPVKIVSIFHTHPHSSPIPSGMDIDSAIKSGENVPYLIYSPIAGFRAWDLQEYPTKEIEVNYE